MPDIKLVGFRLRNYLSHSFISHVSLSVFLGVLTFIFLKSVLSSLLVVLGAVTLSYRVFHEYFVRVAVGLLVGIAIASYHKPQVFDEALTVNDMRISSVSIRKMDLHSIKVDYTGIIGDGARVMVSSRLYQTEIDESFYLKVGQTCSFSVRDWTEVSLRDLNDGFNRYLLSKSVDLYGKGSIEKCVQTDELTAASLVLRRVHLIRYQTFRYLKDQISEPDSALLVAIMLGDRSFMEARVYRSVIGAGLLPLLAASGFHISIIRNIWIGTTIGFINRRFATLTMFLLLSAYLMLTLASPSIQRAVIYRVIHDTSRTFGFHSYKLEAIFLTMLIMCLLNPYIIFSLGFQLSILVSTVILFIPKIELVRVNGFLSETVPLFVVSILAFIASLPILASSIGDVSVFGIVSIPLLIPVVEVLVVAVLLLLAIEIFNLEFVSIIKRFIVMLIDIINFVLSTLGPDDSLISVPDRLIPVISFFSLTICVYLFASYVSDEKADI